MAQRLLRRDDPARTEQLAIDELFVLKGMGDAAYFYTWLEDDPPECCPLCGGTKLKTQNRFSRVYKDCVTTGSVLQVITLDYGFYKYRCLNPECRHIFSQPIHFATVNDNVTRRLEDTIADMVITESSYSAIAAAFQDRLTRQAVGQIFNRWTRTRNERRTMRTVPGVVCILTGNTDRDKYTLLLSCDDGIRILDILYGIDTVKIIASIRRFCGAGTTYVLTDCDPVVYSAAKEALPQAVHIIPAELWLKLVRNDFAELAHEMMRWVSVPNKEQLLLAPKAAEEENLSYELKRIFDARPDIKEPYEDYHYLRFTITDWEFRWHIEELDEWPDTIDNTFRQQLSVTLFTYREYRREISAHQEHWDQVPISLLFATDRLEELIRSRRTFSEEALQAAVLYSTGADPGDWRGVDIEAVINKLMQLHQRSRRNKYEQ